MTVRQIRGEHTTVSHVLRAAAEANAEVEAYVEMAAPGSSGLVPAGADGRRRLTFAAWDDAADAVAGLLACAGVAPGRRGLPAAAVVHRLRRLLPGRGPDRGGHDAASTCAWAPAEQASITARVRPDGDRRRHRRSWPPTPCRPECGHGAGPPARWPLPPAARGTARRVSTPGDPVAIVWTSGSTGVPKGAVFDHANLRAVAAGTDVLSHPGDRRLSPLPFAHVGYMTRALGRDRPRRHHGDHPPAVDARRRPSTCSSASGVTVGQGVPTQWALDAGPSRPRGRRPLRACASPAPGRRGSRPSWSAPCASAWAARWWCATPPPSRRSGPGTRPGDPDDVVATTVGRPVPGVELDRRRRRRRPVCRRARSDGSGCAPAPSCAATSGTWPRAR